MPLKVMVNTNCRLDILLDFARREMLQIAAAQMIKLKDVTAQLDPENVVRTEKLSQIQALIASVCVANLDLADEAGVNMNCRQVCIFQFKTQRFLNFFISDIFIGWVRYFEARCSL